MAIGSAHKPLAEIAAHWYDQLHRDKVADETRREFANWLAASPEHHAAYAAIDRTASSLHNAACHPQMLALRHETALRLTRRTDRNIRRWAVAAIVLIVIGSATAVFIPRSAVEHSLMARALDFFHIKANRTYTTATGERLAVTLSDDSQVTLDTQTELRIAFTKTERTVRLSRGQALFEVAKDPCRPFVVQARGHRFVAVGTAFDVRMDGEQIKVTMLEGTVRAEGAARSANATPVAAAPPSKTISTGSAHIERSQVLASVRTAMTVTAGEQLIVSAERTDRVSQVDPERATSWRRGQVIFEDTRLADAVAELNRYSETKLELADPALADLRLSGAFATGRLTVFIEAVTRYFPIRADRTGDRTVVLSARR